jgi:Mrp family chromosome partitioning ATPase
MSDILQAVSQRPRASALKVDVVALDDAKLFPAPSDDQQAEFAKLANRLLEMRSERGCVLAFASSVRGEGASFVSYNIARLLALGLGRRTLWIDGNFLSPHPKLTTSEGETFADYLADPARVAARQPAGRLSVLAGGEALNGLKAELASATCGQVLDALRQQYDFVILDCPPILAAVETTWLTAGADGTVVIVEARRLKAQVINHALQALRDQKVHLLGTVLNKRRFDLPKVIYDRL